jgi:hypothetical protein
MQYKVPGYSKSIHCGVVNRRIGFRYWAGGGGWNSAGIVMIELLAVVVPAFEFSRRC